MSNIIGANELFGAKSQLVEQVAHSPIAGIATLGGLYQAATAIAAIFFILILVRKMPKMPDVMWRRETPSICILTT